MPGLGLQVSLGEALEVRGGPLDEPELWAIMCQAAEALQDAFLSEEASEDGGQPAFAVNMNTLMLSPAGRVTFIESSFDTIPDRDFIPPEYYNSAAYSEEAIEKIFVFALGMTMYSSADYKLQENQELEIGAALDSLLGGMCEEDPVNRVALIQVLEACSHFYYTNPKKPPSSHYTIKLYKTVLGSDLELDNPYYENDSSYNYRTPRSRGRKSRRPTSKTSMRSRSRSRSRTRDAGRRERPNTIGHDDPAEMYDHRSSYGDYSRQDIKLPPPYHHQSHDSSVRPKHLLSPTRSGYTDTDQSFHSRLYQGSNEPPRTDRHRSGRDSVSRESIQTTYNRLKDRQRKLNALRFGADMADMDYSEVGSVLSETTDFGDRRSLISATSYTQGAYQPGLLPQYGPGVALHMGSESGPGSVILEDDGLGHEASWLRKQQEEVMARKPHERPGEEKPRVLLTAKKATPRKTYGPEFVDNDVVTNLTVPQARRSGGVLRRIQVVLLTGAKLDVACEPDNTNKMVCDTVINYLGLPEKFYFGLSFIHEGEHFFMEPEEKLSKVAPPLWKDPPKGQLPAPFTLYFRVKFYPHNVFSTQCAPVRHLFYLQLRRDILEERCHCTEQQALTLAGYAIQAEYGDRQESRYEAMPEHYLPPRILQRIGRACAKDKLPGHHKQHQGMTDAHAEHGFMKEMQQLPEYGLHFHKMFRDKKDSSLVFAGIGVNGLYLCDRQGDQRIMIEHHTYHNIQKVSFNKRRFSITPKSEAGHMKASKLNFYMDSYKKGRYLVHLCTSYHKFQLMMRLRTEQQPADDDELELEQTCGDDSDYEEESLEVEDSPDSLFTYNKSQQRDAGKNYRPATSYGASSTGDRFDPQVLAQADNSASRISGLGSEHLDPSLAQKNLQPTSPQRIIVGRDMRGENVSSDVDSSDLELEDVVPAEVLKEHHYRQKPRAHDDYVADVEPEQSARQSITNASQPPMKAGECYEIILKKVNNSLGLNVTGGVNTSVKHGGIYVKSMTPDGVAERSGNVHIGDRVLSIDNLELTNVTHKQAVEALRRSPQVCRLVMERGVNPASSPSPQPNMEQQPEPRTSTYTEPPPDRLMLSSVSPAVSPHVMEEILNDMEVDFPFVNKGLVTFSPLQ